MMWGGTSLDAHQAGRRQGTDGADHGPPDLQSLRQWILVTADAQGLYARHGFEALVAPERFMERHDPQVYERKARALS